MRPRGRRRPQQCRSDRGRHPQAMRQVLTFQCTSSEICVGKPQLLSHWKPAGERCGRWGGAAQRMAAALSILVLWLNLWRQRPSCAQLAWAARPSAPCYRHLIPPDSTSNSKPSMSICRHAEPTMPAAKVCTTGLPRAAGQAAGRPRQSGPGRQAKDAAALDTRPHPAPTPTSTRACRQCKVTHLEHIHPRVTVHGHGGIQPHKPLLLIPHPVGVAQAAAQAWRGVGVRTQHHGTQQPWGAVQHREGGRRLPAAVAASRQPALTTGDGRSGGPGRCSDRASCNRMCAPRTPPAASSHRQRVGHLTLAAAASHRGGSLRQRLCQPLASPAPAANGAQPCPPSSTAWPLGPP